jgi:two-component system, chemotaxis family, chemotaxis protein CheY
MTTDWQPSRKAATGAEEGSMSESPAPSVLKMLIVDDVLMNVMMLRSAVAEFGEADISQDPNQALDTLRAAYAAGAPYDLLFLDIMMPGMSGLDVLKVVGKMGRSYATPTRTKVIMVTSQAERNSIVSAISEGAAGYILKPFQPARIREEVRRLADATAQPMRAKSM